MFAFDFFSIISSVDLAEEVMSKDNDILVFVHFVYCFHVFILELSRPKLLFSNLLFSFVQSITGIDDVAEAIFYLEESNWDLLVRIDTHFANARSMSNVVVSLAIWHLTGCRESCASARRTTIRSRIVE